MLECFVIGIESLLYSSSKANKRVGMVKVFFYDYLSLGSNIIKVWDILGGGRLLAGFSNHQKTITSICFDGEYRRLLSGSLDRYVVQCDAFCAWQG